SSMSRAPVKRGCTTIRSPLSRSITTSFARRQLRRIVVWRRRFDSLRAVTSRSTSVLRTVTFSIRRPLIAPFKSRAIVSVSGNSGTACQLAPSDVVPELLSAERHRLGVRSGHLRGLEETGGDGRYGQHAPTRCDELVCRVPCCARVKDFDAFARRRKLNDIAGPGVLGIPGCCNDGRHGTERLPIGIAGTAQRGSACYCCHQFEQRRFHEGHQRLRFRVPEPAVELHYFRSLRRNHESCVQQTLEGRAGIAHRGESWPYDSCHHFRHKLGC